MFIQISVCLAVTKNTDTPTCLLKMHLLDSATVVGFRKCAHRDYVPPLVQCLA
jgi:hypothetical protein